MTNRTAHLIPDHMTEDVEVPCVECSEPTKVAKFQVMCFGCQHAAWREYQKEANEVDGEIDAEFDLPPWRE